MLANRRGNINEEHPRPDSDSIFSALRGVLRIMILGDQRHGGAVDGTEEFWNVIRISGAPTSTLEVSQDMMPTQLVPFLKDFQLSPQDDMFDNSVQETIVDEIQIADRSFPRFINEYWTSGQRQGHSLHEISYRACFKSELPRFFIELLTEPGDLVYDPFMGRGTTLLEAALKGRTIAGNDVNPLSSILLEPRLSPPSEADVEERLNSVPWSKNERADTDLSMFYSPKTEAAIVSLKNYLQHRKESGEEDSIDKWVRMVATNRLTGHSSGFFSVYTMPPNQAVSQEAQLKINTKRNQVPPDRDVIKILLRKTRSLWRNLSPPDLKNLMSASKSADFLCQNATDAIPLDPESVSLVVTSPPFLNMVQYAGDNWLRCWFNAIDIAEIDERITTTQSLEEWSGMIERTLECLREVLKPGGFIAFEVGEVRRGKVKLDEIVAPLGVDAGFECEGIMINQQEFTKTANCWGVKNNKLGTNSNRIVLLKKA